MPLYDPQREIQLLHERLQWHDAERKKYLVRMRQWFLMNVLCASGGVVIGAVLMYLLGSPS